ncbi:MAG: aminotransferase class V-fold PLP-dependent enzyme, partial [Planctomycetales bacterium]|nr:aminotransferase class V-fold PLP-dependent enzyme [Planctomycetales bacterium]
MHRADDICPRPESVETGGTRPLAAPIYPTSVWICESTDQAERMLAGDEAGYVYQRDAHPNADIFADKCRLLHNAERVAVAASGMSALAAAMLSQTRSGDHILVGRRLYGRSQLLLTQEAARCGIDSTVVDTDDRNAVEAAFRGRTRLVVVETIANPTLQVADLHGLAHIAHRNQAKLLVDNTFATPVLCRPLDCGADLVLESVSKQMNGHSDVMLGLLAGRAADWSRVPLVLSAWGLAASPFDCWLASRGLATLHLRVERACANARRAAEFLRGRATVRQVDYPGFPDHPQHDLALRQFGNRFGSVVTFHLEGGRVAADAFIRRARRIPFCPSLGEATTSLSHPESTSH